MKWDCGTLGKFQNQSAIFRHLTTARQHTLNFPVEYLQELCVFMHTPGISNRWIAHNLGWRYDHHVRNRLAELYPEWVAKGMENMMSATYDDASRYCLRGPNKAKMPMWAVPFFLEDVKNKVSEKGLRERWGSTRYHMRKVNFLS